MKQNFAKIAQGKIPLPPDSKLETPDGMIEIPLPLITLGAPAWRNMHQILPLAEADADVEVGMKLKFKTIREVEMTFSWVPPNSGVSQKSKKKMVLAPKFGAAALPLQGKQEPLVIIDLTIPKPDADVVEEERRVMEAARDHPYAAVDLVNTIDGRVIRVLFEKVRSKKAERSYYYIRRQTVRVNMTL